MRDRTGVSHPDGFMPLTAQPNARRPDLAAMLPQTDRKHAVPENSLGVVAGDEAHEVSLGRFMSIVLSPRSSMSPTTTPQSKRIASTATLVPLLIAFIDTSTQCSLP